MQMTRHEAIEVMRYFQNEANMAIDDWGGLEVDRRDLEAMSNEDLLRSLNEQDSVEHRRVTAIVDGGPDDPRPSASADATSQEGERRSDREAATTSKPDGNGGRKRVGPEDEAREDQMDDDGLGPADEDEDEPGVPDDESHGIERSNDLTTP